MAGRIHRGPVSRALLVEANDMAKWVGGGAGHHVHIPPLGLMYLASSARAANPGLRVRIVESSLDCPSDEAFTGILREMRPQVVGIRAIAFFEEELRRIAGLAAGAALIVVGGPIVQAYKARLLEEVPAIDVAVKGEGEATFSRILAGEPLEDIPGIIFRGANGIVENPDAAEIADVDSIPMPAYDLIDLDLYSRHLSYAYNHRRQGILLTSRGCVYDCTFCFSHWQTIRIRSAEGVYEEIRRLYDDYSIRDLYIVDDIFNVSLPRALALFEMIKRGGRRVSLYFANGLRADTVTEEFVDCAIEAGAAWFTFAVESASEDIQRLVRKRVNLEKARHIIAYTQRKGVAVNISTMFGFPTETARQAQMTLDWLGELPKPSLLPYHFCLRFFPGCEIARQALEAGWDAERMNLTARFSYNDLPMGTPTLPKAEMNRILLEYHSRFGLSNPAAMREAVETLRRIGYSDQEVVDMYTALKRTPVRTVDELVAGT
jgi:anaerobic magnesium-protoporphyrin IX monomethyl ester cyclase